MSKDKGSTRGATSYTATQEGGTRRASGPEGRVEASSSGRGVVGSVTPISTAHPGVSEMNVWAPAGQPMRYQYTHSTERGQAQPPGTVKSGGGIEAIETRPGSGKFNLVNVSAKPAAAPGSYAGSDQQVLARGLTRAKAKQTATHILQSGQYGRDEAGRLHRLGKTGNQEVVPVAQYLADQKAPRSRR